MTDTSKKVVALTGASSGIGEATARHLAAAGMQIVVGARREARLQALVEDIRKAGGEADSFPMDVTRREDVEGFIARAEARFGRVDVLVNNAGLMPLAACAEPVCRHYLSNGRREGAYWRVGDSANTPGRSLFVGLRGPRAGKWFDAATGAHGDLLDLILARQGGSLSQAVDEAQRFLALPPSCVSPRAERPTSPHAARRLFAAARSLEGTAAARYLHRRGLAGVQTGRWLRFHPTCFYRTDDGWGVGPALLAAVTDLSGTVHGLQRLWLTRDGRKADLAAPRRSMGKLRGHAVRVGLESDVLLVGEGVETVLSPLQVLPTLPAAAALSATNLAALALPATLRRLYIAVDDDPAGRAATEQLRARAEARAIAVVPLTPQLGDLNDDLLQLTPARFAHRLRAQLTSEDWMRFARPDGGLSLSLDRDGRNFRAGRTS